MDNKKGRAFEYVHKLQVLIGSVNQTHYGSFGILSNAINRLKINCSSQVVSESDPYAEFWMGTHPSGPSAVRQSGELLSAWIAQHNEALSAGEKETFAGNLSFLFKALSVKTALSIQAHPSKTHAEELHKLRPDLYKDDNHKPEIVVPCFGPFEALCGFRPSDEVKAYFNLIPELATLVTQSIANELLVAESETEKEEALKNAFTALMNCPDETLKNVSSAFITRLVNEGEKVEDCLPDLYLRISEDFPGDIGCFCIYFLNYVVLQPGEAMFLGPNIPHAYISGDCLECMACSDNVVRAGLTPKYKDVETLCNMLSYKQSKADVYKERWVRENDWTECCTPPVPDFALARIKVDTSGEFALIPRPNASLLIVIEGEAELNGDKIGFGTVLFLRCEEELVLKVGRDSSFTAYQAFSNV
nr:EOG090X07LH [Triops cancriformis]